MSNSIRITICDCCSTIRYGLQSILGPDPDIEIVREVSSLKEILTDDGEIDMDIMLIDLNQNRPSEIDYLRQFRALRHDVKIIVFTNCSDENLIIEALDLNIEGFELKFSDTDKIINTIHSVHQGRVCLAPCVTTALLDHMHKKQSQSGSCISNREQEVLDLVAKGKTNNEIANALYISICTVKFHVSSILVKLDVKNRTAAALRVA
jgi:NarL family two-component system response regulator LiaR